MEKSLSRRFVLLANMNPLLSTILSVKMASTRMKKKSIL